MNEVPIVILCGGRGIYVDGSGKRLNKSLVSISGRPMVVHAVDCYRRFGFRNFILSAGYQVEEFAPAIAHLLEDCSIQIVDTGPDTPTGERIKRVERLLGDVTTFGVTYSDTLSNVDLSAMLHSHLKEQRVATLVAARLPTRFRILGLRFAEILVRGLANQPVIQNEYINGGFYFFNREIFGPSYLGRGNEVVLENEVLEELAANLQLVAFPFSGLWQHLDSERDLSILESISKEILS